MVKTAHGVTGIKTTIKALDKYEKDVNKDIGEVISKGTIRIQRRAINLAPRRFGDLARSIKTHINKKRLLGVVGSGLGYSVYQELGTWKMRAQPYLLPALREERGKILNGIKKALIKGGKRL